MLKLSVQSQRYRHTTALRDLTLTVRPGERVVHLGPNGAGKSTLLRLLSGALRLQDGAIWLDQNRVTPRTLRRSVARMPQDVTVIPRLTLREQVSYSHWLAGGDNERRDEATHRALEQVGLLERSDRHTQTLSGGQRRRLGLAEALATEAQYVLLDEPTAGLDPAQRQNFRRVLSSLTTSALLVATHETHDISSLFTRVIVIVDGQCIFDDAVDVFLQHAPDGTVEDAYVAVVSQT